MLSGSFSGVTRAAPIPKTSIPGTHQPAFPGLRVFPGGRTSRAQLRRCQGKPRSLVTLRDKQQREASADGKQEADSKHKARGPVLEDGDAHSPRFLTSLCGPLLAAAKHIPHPVYPLVWCFTLRGGEGAEGGRGGHGGHCSCHLLP